MTFSKSIHVAGNGSISSFLMAEWYCIVYKYHTLFIQSSKEGHLGCFNVLASMNNVAISTEVYVSLQINVFKFGGQISRRELRDHMVTLFLVFWGTSIPLPAFYIRRFHTKIGIISLLLKQENILHYWPASLQATLSMSSPAYQRGIAVFLTHACLVSVAFKVATPPIYTEH